MKLKHIVLSTIFLVSMAFSNDSMNQTLSQLKTFKEIKAKITSNVLIDKNINLYLVKGIDGNGNAFSVITDEKGKYLILTNNVIDTKTKKAIKIPVDLSMLKNKQLLTFGTGSKEYFVFTDPQCPYCKKFEAKWDNVKDDVKFNIFFYNLDFHQDANAMSRWIISGKTNTEKLKRLRLVGQGDLTYKSFKISQKETNRLNKLLEDNKKLGNAIGVKGTPSVFDSEGSPVNWPELIKN